MENQAKRNKLSPRRRAVNLLVHILLAVLALCLSGLSAFAEDSFEAGELHVYRVSMEENETVPVRWYKDSSGIRFWNQLI
jgi:hypothetical protein